MMTTYSSCRRQGLSVRRRGSGRDRKSKIPQDTNVSEDNVCILPRLQMSGVRLLSATVQPVALLHSDDLADNVRLCP